MRFIHFVKILLRNLKWLVLIPLCMALSIYYFTRHEKKTYLSETVIYTGIASGYSLDENNANFFTVGNAFDNLLSLINSRETKQEVALQLLAEHVYLKKFDPQVLSWDSYKQLHVIIPDSLSRKLVKSSVDLTLVEIKQYMQRSENNLIYKIVNGGASYYSINDLNKIKPVRINSSDLIRISYETNDPLICKRTLELIIEVFMRKHRTLKEGQTESVVEYFEKQTHDAYTRLDSAEKVFLNFNKNNDIINYYDQTKAVAMQKEELYAQNHNLEMDEKASENSLATIDDNIKGRIYQTMYGADMIREREKLSEVYNKIALNELLEKENNSHSEQLDSLKKAATVMEQSLQNSLNKLYEKSNTPNGIPTKDVLNEWLKTTIAFEQSKAKLSVMDKRKREFEEEYRKYAPLGAMLKKIERAIGVSEREYLDYLHSLSEAKLSQQNNELTSKLTIVDPPYLPLSPNASKRIILIIVGFLAGFIIVFSTVLAKALANRSLKEPIRAAKTIGAPVLGVFPLLNLKSEFIAKAKLRLIQKLLAKVDFKSKPLVLCFISMQRKEGKTMMIDMLYKELELMNYKVEKRVWDQNITETYKEESDIVLMEFPALDDIILKPGFFPRIDYALMICRANRVWSKIDKDLLSIFNKCINVPCSVILNGVHADFAEEYIGEVPGKRTLIRKYVKRIVKLEFGHRKYISKKSNT